MVVNLWSYKLALGSTLPEIKESSSMRREERQEQKKKVVGGVVDRSAYHKPSNLLMPGDPIIFCGYFNLTKTLYQWKKMDCTFKTCITQ